MARILLTGSEGYLGSYVKEKLINHSHEVVEVDAGWFSHPQVQEGRKLISDLCTEDVSKCDVVVHLAWFSSAGDSLARMQEYSLEQTKYLVDQCFETGTRFIFASTASVYGFQEPHILCAEETPTNPICSYGRMKLKAEEYIRSSLKEGQYVIFRKGTLMGRGHVGCRTRFDLVANAFIGSALSEGVINVWQPETWRPMYHVEDAAEAYVQAVEEDLGDSLFSLSHKDYMVLPLAHWIVDQLRLRKMVDDVAIQVSFNEDDVDARSYRMCCDRARQAGLPLGRGIKAVVKGFTNFSMGWDILTDRNVVWMSELICLDRWLKSIRIPEVIHERV